ncbi:TRAP transporter substrate-binding protein DctP [Thermobifida halotolerans]|nr:TRAP transporter substrate-binding protein DctP [Thermobifida halotolerans]
MPTTRRSGGRALRAAALLSAMALVATGCAESGGSGGGGGGGRSVDYGATKEEYAAALADMEPVTLTMQSTAPKGAATGRRFEEYAAAVEEWSGGKITFEIAFSNAVAPPQEVDDALADGRLDVGSVLPSLEPAEFPANNVLWDVSFVGRQTPVDGLLQWHGAVLETAAQQEEIYREFEDAGMHLLLPAFQSGAIAYSCSEPRADLDSLDGVTVASQSRVQNGQVEALGMQPSTVTYAEMFESLERGVVDCTLGTFTVAALGGFIPSAPYFVVDPEVGFANAGGAIAVSQSRWESLPLAARQLLYDRLDVLLTANYEATWDNIADGLTQVEENGGEVLPLAADARERLAEHNEQVLAEAAGNDAVGDGGAFVSGLEEALESWEQKVQESGVPNVDVGYDAFLDWHARTDPDLQPYFDQLWNDAMRQRRPAGDA